MRENKKNLSETKLHYLTSNTNNNDDRNEISLIIILYICIIKYTYLKAYLS